MAPPQIDSKESSNRSRIHEVPEIPACYGIGAFRTSNQPVTVLAMSAISA
jgi:hypothetical protein